MDQLTDFQVKVLKTLWAALGYDSLEDIAGWMGLKVEDLEPAAEVLNQWASKQ